MKTWHTQLAIALLVWTIAAIAHAAEIRFGNVTVYEQADQVTLDADILFTLSAEAEEALMNGIPLTFVTHIEIRNNAAWIWQADLIDRKLRTRLSYHALSGLYQITNLDSGSVTQYATQDAALRQLGEIRGLALIETPALAHDQLYLVRLDSYLDIEALPLTLRPLAHISPDWHLESAQWERLLTP